MRTTKTSEPASTPYHQISLGVSDQGLPVNLVTSSGAQTTVQGPSEHSRLAVDQQVGENRAVLRHSLTSGAESDDEDDDDLPSLEELLNLPPKRDQGLKRKISEEIGYRLPDHIRPVIWFERENNRQEKPPMMSIALFVRLYWVRAKAMLHISICLRDVAAYVLSSGHYFDTLIFFTSKGHLWIMSSSGR